MSEAAAKRMLAQWRRQGHGIWRLTFIVEGYDEEFIHLVPGSLSAEKALALAKKHCANELKEKKKFIHLKSMTKEP